MSIIVALVAFYVGMMGITGLVLTAYVGDDPRIDYENIFAAALTWPRTWYVLLKGDL